MPCYCIRSTNTQFCSNLCIRGKAWLAGQSDTTYILVYNNYQKLKTNISYRHRWQVCQSRMTFYQQQANRRGLRDSGCLATGVCTSRLHLRFKKPPCKKKKKSLLMCFYKKKLFLFFLLGDWVSLSAFHHSWAKMRRTGCWTTVMISKRLKTWQGQMCSSWSAFLCMVSQLMPAHFVLSAEESMMLKGMPHKNRTVYSYNI